ncbi:MAG: hypothetical protein ACKVQC_07280 [Elusimicrobiota bacterium]
MESGQEESKNECCAKSGCGSKGGCRKSCCGAKALLVVMLFLLGGVIGYLMGTRCSSSRYADCKKAMMSACPSQETAK